MRVGLLLMVTGIWLTASGQEESVKPGINDKFLDPQLEAVEWVERFEKEGREVYDQRERIVASIGIEPGETVADVGAGTGLFEPLLSKAAGDEGKVMAVDIAANFLERVRMVAKNEGLKNVETVLCTERSAELAEASVDKVFMCDTYHHFEYPADTMGSIHKALKPGGELVVVDFEREEGKSSDWIMGHVRAGKSVFVAEIEAVGFEKVGEGDFLEENYLVRFRKKAE
ncbi:MAG: methyltransferase domain-containing protein [Verrucomicrobiales bacterium]|nr:methyltransferase domain-containing protein [Verrucomicrobiales bacterium]